MKTYYLCTKSKTVKSLCQSTDLKLYLSKKARQVEGSLRNWASQVVLLANGAAIANSERLQFFLKDSGISDGSHPVNPIRIRALELFATAKTQTGLNRSMNELISVLQNFIYGELDTALADFVASARIFVSQLDGKRGKNEEEFILRQLGSFCLFPHKELKRVEKGDCYADLQ